MQPNEQREQEPRILNGRFRLQSQLAKGGMGVTYRAWDVRSGRPVVVKMPKRALCDEPGFLERFDREVRATIALDHPSIVRVIDHGADAGEPFLVMQFLPGGSLASRISQHTERRREPMPASHLHAWLPRIAAALDHAHSSGVLHRDVKPANIFFDARGLAHLGDFGIAKILEDSAADAADPTLTGTHIALGTHAYMAPERLAPRAVIDGRADQYALAICVFEAITGVKPFRGDTMNIVIEQATLPPPDLATLRPDVPASACQAVVKALAKRPADRFETCSDFAAAMLAEIPPVEQEAGFAWLQCPACSRLIRLPEAAAGRTGRCPRCKAELVIAQRLEGLWLPQEYSASENHAPLPSVVEPPASRSANRLSRPLWWLSSVIALAIPLTLLLLMEPARVPPPGPEVTPDVAAPLPPPTHASQETTEPSIPSLPPPPASGASPADDSPAKPEQQPLAAHVAIPPKSDPAAALAAAVPQRPAEPTNSPLERDIALPAAIDEWPQRRDAAKSHFNATVRWVIVADPGNEADAATQRGAVGEPYYIAQYELTNIDYCVFLNASHAGRTNAAGIGDRAVAARETMQGIRRTEPLEAGSHHYEPLPGMGTKPAELTKKDAITLVNWLDTMYRDGSDHTATGGTDVTPQPLPTLFATRRPDALVFIPSLDEWFKAAYFKGGKPRAGYWKYPTATNEQLVSVSGSMPDGRPSLRGVETTANFGGGAIWAGTPPVATPTDVGANGAPSAFGAFDMGGNVAEWVTITRGNDCFVLACGGDYQSPRIALDRNSIKAIDTTTVPLLETQAGMRLARSVASSDQPLTSDPYIRRTKAAAFAQLRRVNAAVLDSNAVNAINRCSAAEIRRVLNKLHALKLERDGAEADIEATVARLTTSLEATEALLKQREAEMARILPAAKMQQPVATLLDGLSQLADGLQAQQDLRDLRQRYDEQIAPLQAQVSTEIAAVVGLRTKLESRYGKP